MHKAVSHLSRALKSVLAVVFALFALTIANAPQVLAASGVRANVTYQARLMDASGYPVSDGVYQVRFSLYDSAVAGTRLWTASGTTAVPTSVNVSVQDGLFTVLLGDGVTQLPFGDLDWNSDSLYLGVTIGADAEMSPRRPITAVPQAINSAQLSGMSASSSDTFGGQTQFTITQASTTAATSTRSALDVRSNGTSVANDYAFRALTNTGAPVFTITSQGVVSTTNFLVTGQQVCLANGTNCISGGSSTDTLASVTSRGATTSQALTLFGGVTTSLLSVTGTATILDLVATTATLTAVSSTWLEASVGFFTSSTIGSLNVPGALNVNGTALIGDAQTDLIAINSRFITNIVPNTDNNNSLGLLTHRWMGFFSSVTTTNLNVAGQSVCLADGTNCLVTAASSDWTFDAANGLTRLTTTTNDVVIGSAATSTGAPVYVETSVAGTSTLFVGYNTSSNVIIGGTSSTFDFMHPDFAAAFDGNDLFVGGNIGSASSIYTNGEFVVGNASMHIGNGYINKTDGDLSLISGNGDIVVSSWNGIMRPTTDQGVTLGSATERFNGNFGSISANTLNATSSNVYNSSVQRLDYFKTNLQQVGTLSYPVISGATSVHMDVIDHQVAVAVINGSSGGVKVFHTHVQGSSVLNDTSFTIAKPFVRDVAMSRNRLYLLNGATNQLEIHGFTSVSDTGMLGYVGGFDFSTSSAIVVKGNYAYVGDNGKLRVVDISDDLNPRTIYTSVGTISLGTYDMAVDGRWLAMSYEYILGGVRSYRFNISDPANVIGPSFDLTGINPTIAAQDGTLYTIETGGTYVTTRSIENPGPALYLGCFIADTNLGAKLAVAGQYAFAAGQDLNVVNTETCEIAHLANAGSSGSVDVGVVGYHAVMASSNGIVVYDFGGFRAPAADFGEMRIGEAFVTNDLDVYGQGYFGQGLHVAAGGAQVNGDLAIDGSSRFTAPTNTSGYNSAMFINAAGQGATSGLDVLSIATNTDAGTLFLYRQDRSVFDQYAEIGLGQLNGADYHTLLFAVQEGSDANSFTMTPTTSVLTTNFLPSNDMSHSLGSASMRWSGYFADATASQLMIGDLSATGTEDFALVVSHTGLLGGICIDDSSNAQTCVPSAGTSIQADGTITANAFDLAETYESPDALEPGDIVVASTVNELQVVRSANTSTLPMGIVSSQPGLQLGFNKEGAHPIALAGRVPTKVSTINGEIKAGDLLAPTEIPGVAGKAVEDGPIVGIALQGYNGADIGKIEVFVKTSWYSRPNNAAPQVVENNTYVTNVTTSTPDVVRRGLAKIEAGAVKVHVTFATVNGYPFVQATPRGLIVGSWSTDNYTDTGFDIILEQPQTFDAVFGWEARALDGSTMMTMSDGTSLLVDPTTGQVIYQEPEVVPEVVPEPTPEPSPEPAPEPVPEPSPEPVSP